MKRYTLTALWLLCTILSGCATSDAARKLAERTAANTSLLSSEVGRLADHETRIAQLRTRTLADYVENIERSRAAYRLDVALTKKSGDSAAIDLKQSLETWIDETANLGELPSERRAAIVAEIEAIQKPVAPRVEALNQVAAALAELAKDDEFSTRIRFLAGYAREVARLVEAGESDARAAGQTARTSADALADSRKAPASSEGSGSTE